MSAKECPNCGNILNENQAFCPACGTQIKANPNKEKKYNKELESLLFTVDSNAETYLAKNIGAGIGGSIVYEKLCQVEKAYMEIIQKFPTEPKAYMSYVDYMIKFVVKITSITNVFTRTQYYISDMKPIVDRCRNYLIKAKQFASDDEIAQILQLDSELTQKLESINLNTNIKKQQEKNQKSAKAAYIFLGILFGGLFLFYLIAEILGI